MSWPSWTDGLDRLLRLQERAIRGRKVRSLARVLGAKERWLLVRPAERPDESSRARISELVRREAEAAALLGSVVDGLRTEILGLRNKQLLRAYGARP